MKLRFWLPVVLICATALAARGQQSQPAAATATANAEILKLLAAGMPESVVVDSIDASKSPFDTSADALIAFKQADATEAELRAVLEQGSAPLAQQPANQPAQAADGPSLQDTMKSIQDQLNAIGTVSYVETNMMPATAGTDATEMKIGMKVAMSNAVADPGHCRLSFHLQVTAQSLDQDVPSDPSVAESDGLLNISDIKNVTVEPYQTYENELYAKIPGTRLTVSISPAIPYLIMHTVIGTDGGMFYFNNDDDANRAAKVLTHAIELCSDAQKGQS